jgi:hypothetical protein
VIYEHSNNHNYLQTLLNKDVVNDTMNNDDSGNGTTATGMPTASSTQNNAPTQGLQLTLAPATSIQQPNQPPPSNAPTQGLQLTLAPATSIQQPNQPPPSNAPTQGIQAALAPVTSIQQPNQPPPSNAPTQGIQAALAPVTSIQQPNQPPPSNAPTQGIQAALAPVTSIQQDYNNNYYATSGPFMPPTTFVHQHNNNYPLNNNSNSQVHYQHSNSALFCPNPLQNQPLIPQTHVPSIHQTPNFERNIQNSNLMVCCLYLIIFNLYQSKTNNKPMLLLY